MIESEIYNYLNERLGVPVRYEKPSTEQKKYVLYEKTGSSRMNHIIHSTFAFQSYAETFPDAVELNEDVKKTVDGLVELPSVANVSLNSDYYFPNTQTKKHRYQAVFDITHYED